MGMYDYLRCERKLPAPNAQEYEYQTKDTDAQYLEWYCIRADGSLCHEAYDEEDHSDPEAEGFMKFIGSATRVNKRWEPVLPFTGEINFYHGDNWNAGALWWIEFSAYFIAGVLQSLVLVQDTRPEPLKIASLPA